MASFVYTNAKRALLAGELDFDEAGDDIRVMLVMSNTTANTNEDATNITGLGTLDEYDGSAYARQQLGTQATSADNANDRGEFDAVDTVFSGIGVGTRQAQAAIVYQHVDGTAGNDIPIAYIDTGGFPFDGNGGDVTIQWNAEGILQAT